MDMPKPNEAHERLHRLAGEWVGEETMFPSPWDPDGGTATARTHARVALSGFAVIIDYEQERDGAVVFTGHGVWTVGQTGVELHWFDCMGTGGEVFRGDWDGDVLTTQSQSPMGHARMTNDLSEPGVMRTRMEMSADGKEWNAMFEGVHRSR